MTAKTGINRTLPIPNRGGSIIFKLLVIGTTLLPGGLSPKLNGVLIFAVSLN